MTIYTAISNQYDLERNDITCFKEDGYRKTDPVIGAKIFKVLPHLFLKDSSSLWCDANILIKDKTIFEDLLKVYDVVLPLHPDRSDIASEAEVCKALKLDYPHRIDNQLAFYYLSRQPMDSLYACGIMARNHTGPVIRACNEWWAHISAFSWRDQLSFPVAFKGLSIYGLDYRTLTTKNFFDNEVWKIMPHLKNRKTYDL